MASLVIFGTGGVGGYFGGRLAQIGEEVTFVARGEHLRAIREHGLVVKSVKGDFTIQPASATDDVSRLGPVDYVLVAVKTWQLPDVAQAIKPLIGPDTAVIPFQNGVEATTQLASELGVAHVLTGIAKIFSFVAAPGVIQHIGGPASVAFAEADDRPSERVDRLRAALTRAGVALEPAPRIQIALWEKFLFVVSCGTIGAISRTPFGIFRSVPSTRRLLEQAMAEIRDVGRAHGVVLADDIIPRTMRFVDASLAEGTTSLQRDIADGKRSELDAWTGAVVRLGQERGVATPVHAFAYDALLAGEMVARGEA